MYKYDIDTNNINIKYYKIYLTKNRFSKNKQYNLVITIYRKLHYMYFENRIMQVVMHNYGKDNGIDSKNKID